MSYDYWIFRSPIDLQHLSQVDSARALIPGDWRQSGKAALQAAVPEFEWRSDDASNAVAWLPNAGARFELQLGLSEGITFVSIRASYRDDQLALVQRCAQALDGYAFDMQSCLRLWPEAPAAGT